MPVSLVNKLIQDGYLKTPAIISAFRKIKRRDFLPDGDEDKANINAPLSIGYGQTISQPLTVAFMLELLSPGVGDKVLDVGSGSGWTAALLAEIVGKRGVVYGLEVIKELRNFALSNVAKYNFISHGRVRILPGDGWQGLPEEAPFDRIMAAAAAEKIPAELLRQLVIGGRAVFPLGPRYESQEIVVMDKIGNGEFNEKRFPGFVFVPLIHPE